MSSHKLRYCQRLIDKQKYKKAINVLQRMEDEAAHHLLCDIAEQTGLPQSVMKNVVLALLEQPTDRAREIIVANYAQWCLSHYGALRRIHHLGDARILPYLTQHIEEMLIGKTAFRTGNFLQSVSALGRIKSEAGVPTLRAILDRYPLTYNSICTPSTSYALAAADALTMIYEPDRPQYLSDWYTNWHQFIMQHIEDDSLHQRITKPHGIPRTLYRHPGMIDYLLTKIDATPIIEDKHQLYNVFLRLINATDDPQHRRRVLGHLITFITETDDAAFKRKLIQRIYYYSDERLIPIMVDLACEDEYQSMALHVLTHMEYYSPTVVRLIGNQIQYGEVKKRTVGLFFTYLMTVDAPQGESLITAYLQGETLTEDINYRSGYLVLAHYARTSDSAFDVLCAATAAPYRHQFEPAIRSLKQVGKRAVGMLISLLGADARRQRAAIRALSDKAFSAAVPHLMPFLLSSSTRNLNLIISTLLAIDSDAAYAAINAWYDTLEKA